MWLLQKNKMLLNVSFLFCFVAVVGLAESGKNKVMAKMQNRPISLRE